MAPTPDITLYSMATPNGIKASIALEELGLDYKLHAIDISENTQKEPWFLKINPNGRIPAITDGTQRVFESGAILLYLVDKYDPEHKISYEPGTPEYIEQLCWLMFQMGGLGPMQGQAAHFNFFANIRSDYAAKRYLEETRRLYGVLNDRLKESKYLAGDKYTIADIASWGWVKASSSFNFGIDVPTEFPALGKWVNEIASRPAVIKGDNVPPRKRAPEEMKDFLAKMKARIQAMENSDKHP